MKQFIYPAVCYQDYENETSTLLLPDTDIITSGQDVEEAFVLAKNYLKSYIDWSIKFDAEIPVATSYLDTMKLNPKKAVILVDTESNAKKADLIKAENKFQNLMNKYFD